jgi:hypothetical protein
MRDVIFQMEKNKVVGTYGFPIGFFQSCWDIIKCDMMRMFSDFHQHKITLSRINYCIITLIPKSDDAFVIQKFRHICLLQVLFKIVTKALTVRTKPVIHKLIVGYQNAFIKGRFIDNGVMLLQEILEETKYMKQYGVVLKNDFEKASRKVN